MVTSEQDCQLQLYKIKNLPPLPEASLRILSAVNDPEITINELVEVLSLSPSLVARLLGLANSAYFGQAGQIKDLRKAIIQVLGLNLVKSFSLSIALNVQLDTKKCSTFRSDYHWSRSLTTAVLAQKLSVSIKDELMLPTTVYTSGLLLNIGILVAVFLFPEGMNDIFINCEKSNTSVVTGIRQKFGEDSFKLGFHLLNKWHLPVVYQNVLKEFGTPDYSGDEKRLIVLLQLSQSLSKIINEGKPLEISQFYAMLNDLPLSSEKLISVVKEIVDSRKDIQELAAIISG
jgi:HD-like signal output (HDOD) protein